MVVATATYLFSGQTTFLVSARVSLKNLTSFPNLSFIFKAGLPRLERGVPVLETGGLPLTDRPVCPLLLFLMLGVFPAPVAKLQELQPFLGIHLILGRRIIFPFTLGTS